MLPAGDSVHLDFCGILQRRYSRFCHAFRWRQRMEMGNGVQPRLVLPLLQPMCADACIINLRVLIITLDWSGCEPLPPPWEGTTTNFTQTWPTEITATTTTTTTVKVTTTTTTTVRPSSSSSINPTGQCWTYTRTLTAKPSPTGPSTPTASVVTQTVCPPCCVVMDKITESPRSK